MVNMCLRLILKTFFVITTGETNRARGSKPHANPQFNYCSVAEKSKMAVLAWLNLFTRSAIATLHMVLKFIYIWTLIKIVIQYSSSSSKCLFVFLLFRESLARPNSWATLTISVYFRMFRSMIFSPSTRDFSHQCELMEFVSVKYTHMTQISIFFCFSKSTSRRSLCSQHLQLVHL